MSPHRFVSCCRAVTYETYVHVGCSPYPPR
nr:MAG TPA: hydrophobin [Caudoviricetes sp.]